MDWEGGQKGVVRDIRRRGGRRNYDQDVINLQIKNQKLKKK